MKKIICNTLLLSILFTSCTQEETYPKYSLESISYVPDSLKNKHRDWIKETIRASNQHLSAGDYENIDNTIIQVEQTADNLFAVKILGLRKKINDTYWNSLEILPSNFTKEEQKIFDSLTTSRN